MSKLIRIESANMQYDEDYSVESVKVEFRYRGTTLRNGNGSITMSYEDFKDNADVENMEVMVKDAIKAEMEEKEDVEGAE